MFLSPYLLLATMSIAMTPTVTPRYVSNSHVLINFQISPGPSFGLLSLALSTTVTAPPTAIITPSASRFRNGSFSMKGAIMQLEIKATTPSGETIDAGAKPYARKLPASPTVMRMMPAHQYGDLRYDVCLYDCSSPDDWLSPLSSDGRVGDRDGLCGIRGWFSVASIESLVWPFTSSLLRGEWYFRFFDPSSANCDMLKFDALRFFLCRSFSCHSLSSRMCAYRCMFNAKEISTFPTMAVMMPMRLLQLSS
jgi:hypothetical protein